MNSIMEVIRSSNPSALEFHQRNIRNVFCHAGKRKKYKIYSVTSMDPSMPGDLLHTYRKQVISNVLCGVSRMLGFNCYCYQHDEDSVIALKNDKNRLMVKLTCFKISIKRPPHKDSSVSIVAEEEKSIQVSGLTCRGVKNELPEKDQLREIFIRRANSCEPMLRGARLVPPMCLDHIVRATVHWEILGHPTTSEVSLNANSNDSFEKGLGALLNNFNRVVSVLDTFEMRCNEGIYPRMPVPGYDQLFGENFYPLRISPYPVVFSDLDGGHDPSISPALRLLPNRFPSDCDSAGWLDSSGTDLLAKRIIFAVPVPRLNGDETFWDTYPPVPSDEADISDTKSMLRFVVDWPVVLYNVLTKLSPSFLIGYINTFNEAFDKYYNSTRVLAPAAVTHKFNEMHKHIYIYQCLKPLMLEMFDLLSQPDLPEVQNRVNFCKN